MASSSFTSAAITCPSVAARSGCIAKQARWCRHPAHSSSWVHANPWRGIHSGVLLPPVVGFGCRLETVSPTQGPPRATSSRGASSGGPTASAPLAIAGTWETVLLRSFTVARCSRACAKCGWEIGPPSPAMKTSTRAPSWARLLSSLHSDSARRVHSQSLGRSRFRRRCCMIWSPCPSTKLEGSVGRVAKSHVRTSLLVQGLSRLR
mmetsp:Transcript_43691/g.98746  ORF Transcript_43691/g.98746 Transcript_43691/m.98746 type:complete len:206 (-) Transcript_43691:519-1136(-)